MNWIAVALQFVGVFLNARKHALCWPVWFTASGILAILAAGRGDWSLVVLFGGFEIANVYGWLQWRKQRADDGPSKATD